MCYRTGKYTVFVAHPCIFHSVPENVQAGAVLKGLTLKSVALPSLRRKEGRPASGGILKARLPGLWTGEPIDTH